MMNGMNNGLGMVIRQGYQMVILQWITTIAVRVALGILAVILTVLVIRFIGRRIIEFRNFRNFKRSRRIGKN